MSRPTGFPHQRLDVFHAAMELTIGVEHLAAAFPAGHADLKDQVRRSASAVARNIAEGANRWTPREKAARFVIALGEVGECDTTLEMVQRLQLGSPAQVRALRRLTDRIGAMLTALVHRQRRRRVYREHDGVLRRKPFGVVGTFSSRPIARPRTTEPKPWRSRIRSSASSRCLPASTFASRSSCCSPRRSRPCRVTPTRRIFTRRFQHSGHSVRTVMSTSSSQRPVSGNRRRISDIWKSA